MISTPAPPPRWGPPSSWLSTTKGGFEERHWQHLLRSAPADPSRLIFQAVPTALPLVLRPNETRCHTVLHIATLFCAFTPFHIPSKPSSHTSTWKPQSHLHPIRLPPYWLTIRHCPKKLKWDFFSSYNTLPISFHCLINSTENSLWLGTWCCSSSIT